MRNFLKRVRDLFAGGRSQTTSSDERGVQEIDVHELKRLLDKPVPPLLLDVRDPAEKRAADLGGRLVPLWNLPQQLDELQKWADRPVVVYCRSGSRSRQAVEFLRNQGIKEVYNLKGGILSWTRHFGPPSSAQ